MFEEGEWNYVKGALQTIDREYGMGIDGAVIFCCCCNLVRRAEPVSLCCSSGGWRLERDRTPILPPHCSAPHLTTGLSHNITDCHVTHHLFFTQIPHYRLAEASEVRFFI